MSFDFNPNVNLSNVQASSKTTDGGGGNTGYFERGSKEEENLLGFAKDYPNDSFEKIELPETDDDDKSIFELIIEFFKSILDFIKNLFSGSEKK